MYIRFVSTHWAAAARTHAGFFGPAYALRDDRAATQWVRDELARELRWFCENLAVPARFATSVGRRARRNGVCWFRDDAAEHISRARYVCWLMAESGQPISELRTTRPGTLLWQDDHQVVALAERDARHCAMLH